MRISFQNVMPRDFFARLNTFAVVMDCRSPSSPFARALASSSGRPKASSLSAFRKEFSYTNFVGAAWHAYFVPE